MIEAANAIAPTHSRLMREMIDILPIGTEIPVATKMSILRPACYKKFAGIIDAIYQRFEVGSGEEKLKITEQDEMEEFLRVTILECLGEKGTGAELKASTDLFAFGIDSLQATKIRNVIGKKVELGLADGKALGQNIVYEHPSIQDLAQHLLSLGSEKEAGDGQEAAWKEMEDMVSFFAGKVETPNPCTSVAEENEGGHVIVSLSLHVYRA